MLRLQFIEDLENLWWQQWIENVFPSLVPYNKWKVQHHSLKIGDIVLLKYPSKVDKGDYRLARVSDLHPDPHGIV